MSKIVKKIYLNKTNSFKAADAFDEEYYLSISPSQRLSELQFCREQYYKIKGKDINESRKRLRRVIRVIKQK